VAATLYELASGEQLTWGEGQAGPFAPTDPPSLDPASFEKQVAPALMGFFTKALAPDAADRFGTATEMATAWAGIFAALASPPADEAQAADADLAADARLTTKLEDSGLSAHALSGIARLHGVTTVEEFLGVSGAKLNVLPGIGAGPRKELLQRQREWRTALRGIPDTDILPTGPDSVERMGQLLLPIRSGHQTEAAVLRSLLHIGGANPDNAWPSLDQVAAAAEVPPAEAREALRAA
jgi:hypothetical protein